MSRYCALCGRTESITFHHLIPKSCHRNKWFKKNFSKQDMQLRGIDICRRCHSFLHKQFTEKYLGRELNEIDKIKQHPVMRDYLQWALKHIKTP